MNIRISTTNLKKYELEWQANNSLREEFSQDFEAYKHFREAEERGLLKYYSNSKSKR